MLGKMKEIILETQSRIKLNSPFIVALHPTIITTLSITSLIYLSEFNTLLTWR
jgi:hypothetical protein